MELTIECQKRPENSKPNALRRSGRIPAVLYGHNGTESVALTVDARDAGFLVRDASVNNTLIQVNVPDLPWSGKALLREVQAHPWKRNLYHLSFFSVAAHGHVDVEVPLHFVGEAKGVKLQGGTLDTVLTQLSVRCAPDRIPEAINVDISELGLGESIHVSQLSLPEGVSTMGESDPVVVTLVGAISDAAETAEAAS